MSFCLAMPGFGLSIGGHHRCHGHHRHHHCHGHHHHHHPMFGRCCGGFPPPPPMMGCCGGGGGCGAGSFFAGVGHCIKDIFTGMGNFMKSILPW